jgi:hypothetical protein
MFSVFTGSNFGRGLGMNNAANSRLGAQLASYRRQRARLRRDVPALAGVQLA